MSDPLTAGAVQTIFSGGTVANPVLQVIDNKLIANAQNPQMERYR
jgi:hypothetical protein